MHPFDERHSGRGTSPLLDLLPPVSHPARTKILGAVAVLILGIAVGIGYVLGRGITTSAAPAQASPLSTQPVVTVSAPPQPVAPPTPTGSLPPGKQPKIGQNPEVAPHLAPAEIQQWVQVLLRDMGYAPCPPAGLPKGCGVRVAVTHGGIVTLIGQVQDERQARKTKNQILKEVPGVTKVGWLPPSPVEIQQWVKTLLQEEGYPLCPLSGDPKRSCLRVAVDSNSRVTLTGIVATGQEKQQVVTLAETILGVTAVKPNINTTEGWPFTSEKGKSNE